MNLSEIVNFNIPDTTDWFNELWDTKSEKSDAMKGKIKNLIVLAYMPLTKQIAHSLARRTNDPVEDITQVA